MQGSCLKHELRKVISLVDMLRDAGLEQLITLPKIVVLGNQSSGKSSLLEQIVGLDFLPRGSGVVTRRPLELRMTNNPEVKVPYAQFDEVVEGGVKKKFTDFTKVCQTINEVTDKVCEGKQKIVNVPIVLNVYSADCPNLTIVDLPGITSIPVGDQPANIYAITRNLALHYVKEERTIILCVIPANQDLAVSEALKIMQEIDPTGERSLGCLTKIDIMDRGTDATKILRNQEIPLKYGYVGIKNRCQEDVINKKPVKDSLKQELLFFTKSPIYSVLPSDCFGTQSLTNRLTTILYQQIKASLPKIFEEIKIKKQAYTKELEKLGPPVANSDLELINFAWKSISTFLRVYTNSITGIKSPEIKADPLSGTIQEELSKLYQIQFDNDATENMRDKDIEKAMFNFPGDSTIHGFPSIDAFLALQNPLLQKLNNPALDAVSTIYGQMETAAFEIMNEVMMKKFPEFNSRFKDLVQRVLTNNRNELERNLNKLLQSELSYLFTNDSDYLAGQFGPESEKEKKSKKDPLIFELRKRIESYFKLVVRNLRDLVPKQIIKFMLNKALKDLQFESFQFTSDIKKLKEWLNQPSEIVQKRKELTKNLKIFEQSERKIKMDPQIVRLAQGARHITPTDNKTTKVPEPAKKPEPRPADPKPNVQPPNNQPNNIQPAQRPANPPPNMNPNINNPQSQGYPAQNRPVQPRLNNPMGPQTNPVAVFGAPINPIGGQNTGAIRPAQPGQPGQPGQPIVKNTVAPGATDPEKNSKMTSVFGNISKPPPTEQTGQNPGTRPQGQGQQNPNDKRDKGLDFMMGVPK